MQDLPPLLRDQRKVDADHLKLLVVFHFVGAGLALFGILGIFGHYALMKSFMANPKMWQGPQGAPPPGDFFSIFKWFYLAMAVWFLLSLVLNVVSGLRIRSRKSRTFSLAVAGFNCLHMPLGTALGAFTIIVLLRDSVRELYEAQLERLNPRPHYPPR